jgi:branched-chain amino acid transport system permease protein
MTWTLLDGGTNEYVAYAVCILVGGVVTLVYGLLLGPPFAARDPLIKATATIGLALILLGLMQRYWEQATVRTIRLPTTEVSYTVLDVRLSRTHLIGMLFPIVVGVATAIYLKATRVGTAMRALADDREITAMLGVPVRRVEAAAWFGSGILAGLAGLLLSDLVGLDAVTLTFLVVPALAAALIGQLRSLWITLVAGFVIGVVQSSLAAWSSLAEYRTTAPFVLAIAALLYFSFRGASAAEQRAA